MITSADLGQRRKAIDTDAWHEDENGRIHYVSTDDGHFEEWMNKQYPGWLSDNSGNVEFWREIWLASRTQYSKEVE